MQVEKILERILSVILSFILSFFHLGQPAPDATFRTEASSVIQGQELAALPEEITIYHRRIPEEERETFHDSGLRYASRDLLVQFEQEITEDQAMELAAAYGAELAGFINITGTCQWVFPEETEYVQLEAAWESVEKEPGVACVSLNYINPSVGTGFAEDLLGEFSLFSGGNWGFEDVHGEFAWEHRDWMVTPVSVAVLDMGFQEHKQLSYTLMKNTENKDSLHGTHVMGILGANAADNNKMRGIYPEAADRMYAYDVSGDALMDLWTSTVDAVVRGNKIINMSIGHEEGLVYSLYKEQQERNSSEWQRGLPLASSFSLFNYLLAETQTLEHILKKLIDEDYEFLLVAAAGNHSARVSDFYQSSFYKLSDDSKKQGWKSKLTKKLHPSYSYTQPVRESSTVYYEKSDYPTLDDIQNYTMYKKMQKASSGRAFTFQHRIDRVVPPEYSMGVLRIDDETVAQRIICVSAYNQEGGILGMANMGNRVNILAPGENISSTGNQSIVRLTGTSMAAPYVSGALACIWSMDSSLSAEEVRRVLLSSCSASIQDTASAFCKPVLNVEQAMCRMKAYLSDGAWDMNSAQEEAEAADHDELKKPVEIIVRDSVTQKEIQFYQLTVENEEGVTEQFSPSIGLGADNQIDFSHMREEPFVIYLMPGNYSITLQADGYGSKTYSDYLVEETDGLHTWKFVLPPPSDVVNEALRIYLEHTLLSQYSVLPTETLYGHTSRKWTSGDLTGILSAHYQDFDRDNQPELLTIRVSSSPNVGGNFSINSVFYLEMYEYNPATSSVYLAAAKEIPVYGAYQNSSPAVQTGFFTYDYQNVTYLAVDNFFSFNERILTLDLFSYDGAQFVFEKALGYQEQGQGDVYIKEAFNEPVSLTYCGYSSGQQESAGWNVLQSFEVADYNYQKELSKEEEKQQFLLVYQEKLQEIGLYADDLRLWVNQEKAEAIPNYTMEYQNWHDQYAEIITQDVYQAASGEIQYLSGIYTISTFVEPTPLWRKDYPGSLDNYR